MKQTFRKILTSIISIVCICTMLFAVACGEEANNSADSGTTSVSSVAPADSSSAAPDDSSTAPADSSVEPDDSSAAPDDSSSAPDDSSAAPDDSSVEPEEPEEPFLEKELPAAPNYSNDISANIIIGGYDGGPGVEKIVFTFENLIPASAVTSRSLVFSWGGNLGNASRDKLYLCDKKGNKVDDESSRYVAIEYVVTGNQWGIGDNLSPFTYQNMNNWKAMSNFSLTMNNFTVGGRTYTRFSGQLTVTKSIPTLDKWDLTGSHTKGDKTILYASYSPKVPDGEKRPLIIWLHGAGEGGTDPSITILGNKVVALAEEQIQRYFNGAFVLAPQATTFWMSTETGSSSTFESKSIYYDALEELIRKYVADNPKIDASRVYVGGCSNGGWCTLEVVSRMGNFFAAAYPVCAPYTRAHFNDDMFANLVAVPMWMIAANNDTSVSLNNNANSKALYIDMLNAGHQNVYFSLFNDVNLTSEVGGANYAGHYSWIWVFRDQVKYVQAKTGANGGAFTGNDYNTQSTLTADYRNREVNLWQWLSTFKNDGSRIRPLSIES